MRHVTEQTASTDLTVTKIYVLVYC